MRRFKPGDCVRYSGKFLRNTGQMTGGAGLSKWIVVEHDCPQCEAGEWVAVNEPSFYDPDRPQHIAVANLMPCRGAPRASYFP